MRLWAMLHLFSFLLFFSCSWRPQSDSYAEQYAHLEEDSFGKSSFSSSPDFLIILIDAKHLDYSDGRCLLKTLVKHPSDGSKNSDVGHAWIYLQGNIDGQDVVIEGGHSGELGICQARYFEGIMNYVEYGYANPTSFQCFHPRYEPNPIKYLWEVQRDGFFQKGPGRHTPTFAAKIPLTKSQFKEIVQFIENYEFSEFSLVENQCSTFAAGVAELGGLSLSHRITVPIPPKLSVGNGYVSLWEDCSYAAVTLSSPDILEKSLMEAVKLGKAEYALEWYKTHRLSSKCLNCQINELLETVVRFPSRYKRMRLFNRTQDEDGHDFHDGHDHDTTTKPTFN